MLVALAQQPSHERLSLWPDGAPGSAARKSEPEQAKDYWVKNVHDPSVEVFLPPPDKATGAAVVVVPGGGHRLLVYNAEGREPAEFLANLGIAAFALKYRLAREEGSTYTIEGDAVADTYRALRLVRSRAEEWHIDPHRVGVMGFSAGGELVGMVAFPPGEGNATGRRSGGPAERPPGFRDLHLPGPAGRAGLGPEQRAAGISGGRVGRSVLRRADGEDPADVSRRRRRPSRRTSPRRAATASTWASGRS